MSLARWYECGRDRCRLKHNPPEYRLLLLVHNSVKALSQQPMTKGIRMVIPFRQRQLSLAVAAIDIAQVKNDKPGDTRRLCKHGCLLGGAPLIGCRQVHPDGRDTARFAVLHDLFIGPAGNGMRMWLQGDSDVVDEHIPRYSGLNEQLAYVIKWNLFSVAQCLRQMVYRECQILQMRKIEHGIRIEVKNLLSQGNQLAQTKARGCAEVEHLKTGICFADDIPVKLALEQGLKSLMIFHAGTKYC